MNEIKRCSLAGISFTLEPDAYDTLKEYIQSLHDAYRSNPDGEEIVADIEARIAEIILSTIPAEAVVTKPLVKNIIKQLGSAGASDPLNQRSTVGWKALKTAEILVEPYMYRVECCSAFSEDAQGN